MRQKLLLQAVGTVWCKQDGSVWATGYNKYGQLGHRPTTNSERYVEVIHDGVTTIAAGAFHSMVLKEDGSIWATGTNAYGQFGDGSTKSESKFTKLASIVIGSGHNTVICI